MYFLLLLLPLYTWAYLPDVKMDALSQQYTSVKKSIVTKEEEQGNTYFVVVSSEEKLFDHERLEEEKPFLKAGIKQALFTYFLQRYPKMQTLEISGLIYGKFWEDQGYYHAIAQVPVSQVKPSFEMLDNKKSSKEKALFKEDISEDNYMKPTSAQQILRVKTEHLEKKLHMHPYSTKLLEHLRNLYKDLGDVEAYEKTNERIMDAKMHIEEKL